MGAVLALEPFHGQTIPRLLELRLDALGGKTLVRHPGGERTYADQRDAVARMAGTLTAAGVGRGDRVSGISGNRIELLDLFLACGCSRSTARSPFPRRAPRSLTRVW